MPSPRRIVEARCAAALAPEVASLKLILAFWGWDRAMRSMIPAPEVDDLADYA
jgi:hypothetical protein